MSEYKNNTSLLECRTYEQYREVEAGRRPLAFTLILAPAAFICPDLFFSTKHFIEDDV